MPFDPSFLDEIRARLPVSQVVARKVQLKRAGREFKGLSPFKDEKTPSFTVNDQKGFYHCFASGEHGDIFKFVMQTEGLSFPEAVERLAGEAGVPMPVRQPPTPEMERRRSERERLHDLLTHASNWYQAQLTSGAGREARSYLDGRGLTHGTIKRFQIGFAPNDRNALKQELARCGFTDREMALSGMAVHGEDIAVPYDRFRGRIMFPIHDLKGRVIAFGGRALDPNVPAKYLNSPETPLFHKGAILYNAAGARQAIYDRGEAIVVEGYMDVVALAQAGFGNAVAPLGTALTELQIKLLWRMAEEPLLCFDGDAAGMRAAFRAIDTVIPHLTPGRSLRFAFLPDGMDPDDLVRAEGPDAFRRVLAQARPLADVLWEREWADGNWHTPERRAALEKQIHQIVARIADQSVRSHYQRAMRDKLFQAWRASQAGNIMNRSGYPGTNWRHGHGTNPATGHSHNTRLSARRGQANRYMAPDTRDSGAQPSASTALKKSRLVAGGGADLPPREVALIRTLLNHPWLIDDQCEEIAALEFASHSLSQLRDGILSVHASNNPLDRQTLHTQLSMLGLSRIAERTARALTHKSDRFAEPDAERTLVETGWRHAVTLHARQSSLKQALDAARRAWDEDGSEEAQAQIFELKRRLFLEDQETGAITATSPDNENGSGNVSPPQETTESDTVANLSENPALT